jgi:hypothetical protein
MIKVHPIISITLGIIVTFSVGYVGLLQNSPIIPFIVATCIGGFIATCFAKEHKTRYGIYEGICVVLILFILFSIGGGNSLLIIDSPNFIAILFILVLIVVTTGICGSIGKQVARYLN